MNFASLKALSIPEGVVTKIEREGMVLFEVSLGVPIGDMPVGSSVFMNVGGVRTEFVVVHQGSPGSRYRNADGTWLLMKDVYERHYWGSTEINDYENSDIHARLNDHYPTLFDSGVQAAIKQIKIPYWKGDGETGALTYGTSGLSTKLFLLSELEAGFDSTLSTDTKAGNCLSYFSGMTDDLRIAYFNGSANKWWLRDIVVKSKKQVSFVWESGKSGNAYAQSIYNYGVRPALVLPNTLTVDSEFNVIA